MAVIVQKYGGSSLADIAKLHAVAERIVQTRRAGHDVVVVVSAMGKTTENLLALARDAARVTAHGTTVQHDPPRRELDMLVSTGERVSMALVSIALQARGVPAISFTGSQSGIITCDRHFDARILEIKPRRIEDELARGRVVIVAGYQGMSAQREITTLGRGGSDTTAVALAAALGAEHCEIYSDVDGVYSADPRTVGAARHLPELDYETMQQMAEAGAKVLNAQAIEWAKRSGVMIHARRTGDDFTIAGGARETRVTRRSCDRVRSVVGQRQLAVVRAPRGREGELMTALAALSLPIRDLMANETGVTALLPLLNVPDWQQLRRELALRSPRTRIRDADLGSVSLVGLGVGTCASIVAQALRSVNPRGSCFFTSPLRVSCVVPSALVDAIERSWHAQFVAEPEERLSA